MDTRLLTTQRKEQTLSMSMGMRMSLALLSMSSEELDEALAKECARNPFLRTSAWVPAPARTLGSGVAVPEAQPVQSSSSEELLHQIGLLKLSAEQRRLAEQLVHFLDERGFIADPAEEICAYLGTSPDLLRTTISVLQLSVEPAGVFAWSLSDSFRIQLLSLNRLDPIILLLLDRLDLVARQDVQAIRDLCSVDAEDAVDMIADIRALNPSPLVRPDTLPIVGQEPELVILPRDGGELSVELNTAAFPNLLCDDGLFDRLRVVELTPEALKYYRDCHKAAAGYVLALQKRANTLLRIGQQIAASQNKYLKSGHALDRRPLTTAILAEALGVNKSTVSRALKNCRIMTANGVRKADEMLVRPLSRSSSDKSQGQALQRLSVMIRAEDKRSPYSDLELVAMLRRAGFDLSRRTIAKYRDLLGVPGKTKRRAP